MGEISLLTVFLAALAFFATGALWYGPLFGKAWQRLTGLGDGIITTGPRPRKLPFWLILALCFAFEVLISLMLGHQYARTDPSDRAKMMIAVGYGAAIMTPALGINYLFQMRPGKLFAIDAGYFIFGMAAMGAVYSLRG